jgi:hypothetical protein
MLVRYTFLCEFLLAHVCSIRILEVFLLLILMDDTGINQFLPRFPDGVLSRFRILDLFPPPPLTYNKKAV